MSEIERRAFAGEVECRSGPGGGLKIAGYAAVFNTTSRNLGGFTEDVAPPAFNRSKAAGWRQYNGDDVVCRFNHDPRMLLGTTGGKTLHLATDSRGLSYEATLPQTRRDIHELIERGDIRHSSFAFRCAPGGDDWSTSPTGDPHRRLLDVDLIDVAPVLSPGYVDASVAQRSLDSWRGGSRGLPAGAPLTPAAALGRLRLRQLETRRAEALAAEQRAALSSSERENLPDSAFAYIEPGGRKDSSGRTRPDSLRHFPIHDAAHVRNALARIAQGAQFADEAKPAVHAAARRLGVDADAASGWDGDGDSRAYDSVIPAAPGLQAAGAWANFFANTAQRSTARVNGKAAASLQHLRP